MATRVVRSGLLLVALCLLVQGQRISERKCAEYRKNTIKTTAVIALTLNPKPVNFSRFTCSKTVDLIVGGEDAKPGEFPHQALLGYPGGESKDYEFKCGGTLISDRYVLTAAHCFKQGFPTIVRLAENSLHDDYDDQVDIEIADTIMHPDYKFRNSYNDIALVELAERVHFSKLIQPACLWAGSNINVTSVIATGFGLNETAGSSANILQKVQLDFMDKSECDIKFRGLRPFPEGVKSSQLCIGSDAGGKDTCQGDSGGPVQVITEPKGCTYHVIGVTSTALASCGVGRSAAIYTRVSDYLDWIEGIVWKK